MVYEETKGRYRLAIYTDDNPISPRQMDANIGRMVCFHSRYHLGDRHDYANKDEFLLDLLSSHFMDEDEAHTFFERLDKNTSFIPPFASEKLRDDVILKELSENYVFLPLYLLDHSGLSMATTSFGDYWDSGQVGWIYASKATVIEEYGEWSEETIEKVKEFMKGEVSTYDDYLRGENYIYDIIDDSTGEVIDGGVWTGSLEDLKEDARDMIPEPLSDEEYNKLSLALATKLRSEYDAFVEETKKLTPQEIVDRAYQLTFKYDLMATVNDCDFSREEFKALLNAPNALETMYNEWIYMATPFKIIWCENSANCIAVFIGIYVFGVLIYYGTKPKLRQGEEHGSAKWGTTKQLNTELKQDNNIPLTKHVSIGMDTHKHRRNLNILALGGSGAGKTRSLALPGIMTCNCSYVVTDPKGEILQNVGHLLKEQGYKVRAFNLVDFSQSDGYNPFRYIRDDKDVLKLITNLIRNTTPKSAGSSDPFWEKAETALLEALMFYLLYEAPEDEQNFGMIMTMLSYADVREEDSGHMSPLDLLFNQLEKNKPNHVAVKQYKVYKQAAGKTAKSINISLAVRLAAFNLEQICSITDHDEMDFGELGEKKMAIFAIIPDNDTSLSYLVGMLYTQIIQELYFLADHVHNGRLPIHVRFILDEFANVSLPEEFDKSLATMRSREMSATIIVQNLAQLKGLYKEHGWETITGNCDTLLYLGGNEQSTHEYISKLLGKETIDTRTHGQTKGRSGSYSTNMQITGRELLTPDEVRVLDNKFALLFVRGFPAIMDKKYDLESHPNNKKTKNGGYPPYIHKEDIFRGIPFAEAFDFANAEDYEYFEGDE